MRLCPAHMFMLQICAAEEGKELELAECSVIRPQNVVTSWNKRTISTVEQHKTWEGPPECLTQIQPNYIHPHTKWDQTDKGGPLTEHDMELGHKPIWKIALTLH